MLLLSLALHQFHKRVVVVLPLHGNAFKALTAILGTLYIAKDSLLKCGKEAFLGDILEQLDGVAQHFLDTVTADATLYKLHFLADALHVIKDVLGIFDREVTVAHKWGVDCLSGHTQ